MSHRLKKIIVMMLVVMMLTGCGNCESARRVKDSSQMPDIVFMDVTVCYYDDSRSPQYTFYDKNGNHYISDNPYVSGLTYKELVNEYAEGKLDDKITLNATCDVDELFENYQKLCKVSKNKDFEILYPGMLPDVEADEKRWYGVYYDKTGELQFLKIHEQGCTVDFYTNDEQADEIYNWYIGTLQK